MTFLIIGIIIFFGMHLVPVFELKNKIINRIGDLPYKGIFSVISGLGLGLMIYGKGDAEFITVWQPIAGAHWLPMILMWPASVLIVWAQIPCSMKISLRHPMLLGVLLFSISHLFANGDLATIMLIGSFGLYAILTMLRLGFQKSESAIPSSTPKWNLFGLLLGTLIYGLVFIFHQQITGTIIPV